MSDSDENDDSQNYVDQLAKLWKHHHSSEWKDYFSESDPEIRQHPDQTIPNHKKKEKKIDRNIPLRQFSKLPLKVFKDIKHKFGGQNKMKQLFRGAIRKSYIELFVCLIQSRQIGHDFHKELCFGISEQLNVWSDNRKNSLKLAVKGIAQLEAEKIFEFGYLLSEKNIINRGKINDAILKVKSQLY